MRILALAVLVGLTACAQKPKTDTKTRRGKTRRPQKRPTPPALTPASQGKCLARLELGRADIPYNTKVIPAGPIDKANCPEPKRTKAYRVGGEPLLCFTPDKRSVTLNAKFFSKLTPVDAPRAKYKGETVLGTWKPGLGKQLPPRDLVFLLMSADIITTYWHMASTVCLERETKPKSRYAAHFRITHVYYTNRKNVRHYRLTVHVDKDGAIRVAGPSN